MIKQGIHVQVNRYIQYKINVKHATTFYHFAKLYKLTNLSEIALSYIERCFTMVVETSNFLELDFSFVAKIFTTSGIRISSELQVLDAADAQIKYNKKERTKFSTNLLMKVRLPLLSYNTLNHLLNKVSSFSESEDCVAIFQEVLYNKEDFVQQRSSICFENIYRTPKQFKLLVCGGNDGRLDGTKLYCLLQFNF